ncbi:hypothetical protein KCW65_22895, partial [Mycobacterium tuberculosis]|nr:hypothetical protein [Mycobacterium tuberculosis]
VDPDRPAFLGTSGFDLLDNVSVVDRFEAGAADWVREHGGSVVELHAYALQETGVTEVAVTEAAVSGAAVPQGGASQGAVSPGTVLRLWFDGPVDPDRPGRRDRAPHRG